MASGQNDLQKNISEKLDKIEIKPVVPAKQSHKLLIEESKEIIDERCMVEDKRKKRKNRQSNTSSHDRKIIAE